MKLLAKEFRLCMHPAAFIMLGLSAMVLIPNYPYAVSYLYMTLAIYFVCLTGRENHDPTYTLTLPVSRRDMVRGRILFACCLEGAQLVASALFVLLKGRISAEPNLAGLDANLALPGDGLILFGLFNLIFFPAWYKDIQKIGGAFIKASTAVFLYVALGVVATYAVPFVRDCLDTPDPQFLAEKLLFDAAALLFFAAAVFLAVRLSTRRVERQDLTL